MSTARIEAVLVKLDQIIEQAASRNSPEAYFAYVYRFTTAAIKRAIEAGRFEDNERMETFDVSFAQLYLDAHSAFHRKENCPDCWALSLNSAQHPSVTILQHIALGMNAHINLDLGVAAGRLMWGKELQQLRSDFDQVNDVLAEITDKLQAKVARVSPLLGVVDWLAKDRDERLLGRGMQISRTQAWTVAERIWKAGPAEEAAVLSRVDRNVTQLGNAVLSPRPRMLRWLLKLSARLEPNSVQKVIKALQA